MKEQLISFETAVLAKEKGYTDDSKYWEYYDEQYKSWFSTNVEGGISKKENTIKRPTQSLLQKWLREKHSIHVHCFTYALGWYVKHDNTPNPESWTIDKRWDSFNPKEAVGEYFKTYEEALEFGLQKALELLR